MRKAAALCLVTSIVSAPAWSDATIYGDAIAVISVEATEPGTALHVWNRGTLLGFKGDMPVNKNIDVVFDANASLAFFSEPDRTQGFLSPTGGEYVGLDGDFGRVRIFRGFSPLAESNSHLQLMNSDPTSFVFLLGEGSSITTLPTATGYQEGVNYRSPELSGGLSLNVALLPAEDPEGETGFSLATKLDREDLRVQVAAEVNGEVEQSELYRAVAEVDVASLTVGGLVQGANNSSSDTSALSVAGYVRMPIAITQWDTRLQLVAGQSTQQNSSTDYEESQVFLSAVHEIEVSENLSFFSFAESYTAEEEVNDHSAGGGGIRIRF